MEPNEKSTQNTVEKLFQDYYNLVPQDNETNSVVVLTEWNQDGDAFRKFSLYDHNYTPVSISSTTSFICEP